MKDILIQYAEKFMENTPVIILSMFGAVVRALNAKKRVKIGRYLSKIATGVFVGYLAHLLLANSKIDEEWKLACIMLSGYCAGDVLDILVTKFLEKLEKIKGVQ